MEEVITLGGGCFWCTEAIFNELNGVLEVESGYSGGTVPNPTYDQVCTGKTGHAEVIQITFDPEVLALHDVLTIFFTLHDPTTLNQQGADHGTQYRSVIFYRSPEQREVAQQVMEEISEQGIWEDPLVTELAPFEAFYPAEDYHQKYYARNEGQMYCQIVIEPKVAKLRKLYHDKLKKQ
jgi:peptide-methionine (S)-S-oxide reductase